MGLQTTPNALRYPVRADTPDVPRDVQRLAEDVELALVGNKLPWFGKPYVESGLAITAGTGLAVNLSSGVACVNGWRFAVAAATNIALTASTTNHLWLTQVLTSGRHSGYTWTVNTTTAVPANSVYVGQIVTGGAAPSTMDASFRGVIAPGTVIDSQQATALVAAGATGFTKDVLGDGVTPVRIESSFTLYANTSAGTTAADIRRNATSIKGSILVATAANQAIGQSPFIREAAWVGKRTYDLTVRAGVPNLISASATDVAQWVVKFDF